MTAITRAELESAFQHYQATVEQAASTGDWTLFAGLFTEDVDYYEHVYGRMSGRAAVSTWATRTMTRFPGNCMTGFPISWSMLDESRGWIVCEVQNPLRDPGDGSAHGAANITKLHYAGDNLFNYEEDAYNPANFLSAVIGWARVSDACGTLPEEGRAWLDAMAPGWKRD
ncbi:MAG: nuclear transport factor 2 family protein [Jatrophihabitantaceae bacterium]